MSSIKELVEKIHKNQSSKKTFYNTKSSQEIPTQNDTKNIIEGEEVKRNEQTSEKKNINNQTEDLGKKKTEKKKRFFIVQVCTSQKSCGNHYGPYIWERICNDYNQNPECESFEIQGFRFEKSPCQGLCKKASNIRIKETQEKNNRQTQFSYLTPLKASKLIKNINSGATPDNIKKI